MMYQLLFVCAYTIVAAVGFWLAVKTFLFIRSAKRAVGKVVGSEHYITAVDLDVTFSEKIAFTAEDGKQYIFSSRSATIFKKQVGKEYPVLYKEQDPSDACIDSFIELHLPWLIFLSVGVLGNIAVIVATLLFS